MKTAFSKVLSCILALSLVLSLGAVTAFAESDNVIDTEEEIRAAIDAIPVGGSGEITIENVMLGLAESIYIDTKDVTFNLKNAQISTTAECCPVILAIDGNITINSDNVSSLTANSETYGMGVIRLDNGLWDEKNQTHTKTFNLIINGGKYFSAAEDAVCYATPGTVVTFTNVMCDGIVDAINMETVGVPEYGTLVINSGRFTSDIRDHAAAGKFACNVGNFYYVREKETSDLFKKLVPNNTITFDYAPPKSIEDEALFLLAESLYYENPEISFNPETFSKDFKTCEIGINMDTPWEEVHAVNVVWNYDEKVLDVAETYIEKFPEDRNWFSVSDLELVNYYSNYNPDSESDSFANYSGELKSIFNNANFTLEVETRGGGSAPFYTETIGSAKLMHDGKVYFSAGMLGARGEHVVYVPENTANTKDALLAAAQKKIDDYIGKGKITVTAKDYTITDYYNEEIARYDSQLAEAQANLTAEMAKPDNEKDWFIIMDCQYIIDTNPTYKQQYIDSYQDGGDHAFLNNAEGDFVFNAKVVGKDTQFDFIIDKDDTKMDVPTLKTVDLNTNVSVSLDSSALPLDTTISVEKLTEGADYEKVMEVLNVGAHETFDIKLHSATLDSNVTKPDSGNFKVSIPVSSELAGKDLVVYYVDANNNVTPHTVTFNDDKTFATFETDHFSVYTLAAKTTAGSVGDTVAQPDTPKNDASKNEIPKTGQSSAVYLFMITLVLGGLGIMASYRFAKER